MYRLHPELSILTKYQYHVELLDIIAIGWMRKYRLIVNCARNL